MGNERVALAPTPWQAPKWLTEACALSDGAPVDGVLMGALHSELQQRAVEAGAGADWPAMALSGLQMKKAGLPDWWVSNGNLLLAAPDAKVDVQPPLFGHPVPTGALLLLGAGVTLNRSHIAGGGSLVAFGDRCYVPGVVAGVIGRSTIMIGEDTSATFGAVLDARNGGSIIVGPEGMWADGLFIMTDDGHAIRDLETGARINVFGGRIIVERHVWFGMNVRLLGDCRIGADAVVGINALVKNAALPKNSVCVGQPAVPVRTGTTWSRWDEP